ncbi:hypothetical protein Hypma_001319 [Hypsizygus marmoreus]|uniref:Uncharacterized protein n=1 Tax=Hypsizygus marmoreus TaxID=39966 RepID=A0A369K657_HYPMA|nr:hypothetical protein Hypma_001319 [Hypsizygus marmoreus]
MSRSRAPDPETVVLAKIHDPQYSCQFPIVRRYWILCSTDAMVLDVYMLVGEYVLVSLLYAIAQARYPQRPSSFYAQIATSLSTSTVLNAWSRKHRLACPGRPAGGFFQILVGVLGTERDEADMLDWTTSVFAPLMDALYMELCEFRSQVTQSKKHGIDTESDECHSQNKRIKYNTESKTANHISAPKSSTDENYPPVSRPITTSKPTPSTSHQELSHAPLSSAQRANIAANIQPSNPLRVTSSPFTNHAMNKQPQSVPINYPSANAIASSSDSKHSTSPLPIKRLLESSDPSAASATTSLLNNRAHSTSTSRTFNTTATSFRSKHAMDGEDSSLRLELPPVRIDRTRWRTNAFVPTYGSPQPLAVSSDNAPSDTPVPSAPNLGLGKALSPDSDFVVAFLEDAVKHLRGPSTPSHRSISQLSTDSMGPQPLTSSSPSLGIGSSKK